MLMLKNGPILWYILHTLTYNFINNNLNQLYLYYTLEMFHILIPCKKCKRFYIKFFNNFNPHNDIKHNNSINWAISLHNTVNKKLNKPILTKTEIDRIYLNKEIDNEKILNYLIYSFNTARIDTSNLVMFITSYQMIYPCSKLKLNFIKKNFENNNLIKSRYSFKYQQKLIEEYKNLINSD